MVEFLTANYYILYLKISTSELFASLRFLGQNFEDRYLIETRSSIGLTNRISCPTSLDFDYEMFLTSRLINHPQYAERLQ